jgi:hypothetical protein
MKWTKRASEIANGKYVEIEPKEVKALQLEGTSFDIHDAMSRRSASCGAEDLWRLPMS